LILDFWLYALNDQMKIDYTYTGNYIINIQYKQTTYENLVVSNIPELWSLTNTSAPAFTYSFDVIQLFIIGLSNQLRFQLQLFFVKYRQYSDC
jgi:hypothetical protein